MLPIPYLEAKGILWASLSLYSFIGDYMTQHILSSNSGSTQHNAA
jgi:hypothetical protein